ncbi:hypothetical protein ACEPPN_019101 [Leptodophora sp. 'Broadleaf-Isolate-01']
MASASVLDTLVQEYLASEYHNIADFLAVRDLDPELIQAVLAEVPNEELRMALVGAVVELAANKSVLRADTSGFEPFLATNRNRNRHESDIRAIITEAGLADGNWRSLIPDDLRTPKKLVSCKLLLSVKETLRCLVKCKRPLTDLGDGLREAVGCRRGGPSSWNQQRPYVTTVDFRTAKSLFEASQQESTFLGDDLGVEVGRRAHRALSEESEVGLLAAVGRDKGKGVDGPGHGRGSDGSLLAAGGRDGSEESDDHPGQGRVSDGGLRADDGTDGSKQGGHSIWRSPKPSKGSRNKGSRGTRASPGDFEDEFDDDLQGQGDGYHFMADQDQDDNDNDTRRSREDYDDDLHINFPDFPDDNDDFQLPLPFSSPLSSTEYRDGTQRKSWIQPNIIKVLLLFTTVATLFRFYPYVPHWDKIGMKCLWTKTTVAVYMPDLRFAIPAEFGEVTRTFSREPKKISTVTQQVEDAQVTLEALLRDAIQLADEKNSKDRELVDAQMLELQLLLQKLQVDVEHALTDLQAEESLGLVESTSNEIMQAALQLQTHGDALLQAKADAKTSWLFSQSCRWRLHKTIEAGDLKELEVENLLELELGR